MEALALSLLAKFWPVLIGIGAVALAYLRGRSSGKQTERNRQRAKEADSLEHSLQELANASDARNRVDPRDELQHDPYNRDQ